MRPSRQGAGVCHFRGPQQVPGMAARQYATPVPDYGKDYIIRFSMVAKIVRICSRLSGCAEFWRCIK